MDSTSFWKLSTGMTCQILAKAVHNSVRFVGAVQRPFTPCSETSQSCSTGFKSELLGRQFMTEKSEECSSNQRVANRDFKCSKFFPEASRHVWHLRCMEQRTLSKIPGVSRTHPAASTFLPTKSSGVATGVL
ncbi:hypothetical protein TNCV_4792361 [Trichonephila clavipes]|nr:hypothetical protein TNCV_4792361 [Trichonephila clavipes]